MPRMNSSRSVMFGLIAGALALVACGKSDTILALRVNTSDGVGLVSKVHVKITQGSQALDQDLEMLPTKEIDVGQAGMTSKATVFDSVVRRITLPDSFSDGDAKIDVQAFDEAGSPYLDPQTTHTDIRDNEATTAEVTLKLPEEPDENDGDGTGGTGGTGGEGGNAGAASGGAAAGGGAGGAAAGGGGEANTAGGGGEATAGGGNGGSGS